MLQQLESVDRLTIQKIMCITIAHFEYTEFSAVWIHLPVLSSTFTGSSSVCHPAATTPQQLDSSRGWSKKFNHLQHPSWILPTKLVRHFHVMKDVCACVSKWRNSQIPCNLLIPELGNCKFLGLIDFDTSKGYNLSTAFLEFESLAVISRSTTPT